MSAANLSSASRIIVSITGKRLVQCPRGELDLGGVDTSLARPTEDGTPPTGPTTDHMSRTACLDGKMSTATIRRANADDTEVLGIIGPAAYADAYGYLWDRPDAYSDQLRTFGPQAFESLLARPEARVWIGEAGGTIVGFLSMILGSVDPIVAEDIITGLLRIRWLLVIARNSSFTYKGRSVDVKQVGRELGVRYVLEGSVRRVANRVRITTQLVNAETGVHVWAERYDRSLDNIFAIQDEITLSAVGAIEPSLREAEIERGTGGLCPASAAARAALGLYPNSRLKVRLTLEASAKQRSSAIAEIDAVVAGSDRTACASSRR